MDQHLNDLELQNLFCIRIRAAFRERPLVRNANCPRRMSFVSSASICTERIAAYRYQKGMAVMGA